MLEATRTGPARNYCSRESLRLQRLLGFTALLPWYEMAVIGDCNMSCMSDGVQDEKLLWLAWIGR